MFRHFIASVTPAFLITFLDHKKTPTIPQASPFMGTNPETTNAVKMTATPEIPLADFDSEEERQAYLAMQKCFSLH